MPVTHKLIVQRFMEGLGVAQIGTRYTLADWEVEEALRSRLSEQMQRVLPLESATVEQPFSDTPSKPEQDDSLQLTIAEVYGTVTI
jgi:hypothetical protein